MNFLFKCVFYDLMSSDINECLVGNDCHDNATCTNTDGSYLCTCNKTFTGNGTRCKSKFAKNRKLLKKSSSFDRTKVGHAHG